MFGFLRNMFKSRPTAKTLVKIPAKVSATLDSPKASLDFLVTTFRPRILDDGALRLPRLDLVSAWGPRDDEGITVHYGDLLLSAVKVIDPTTTITKIVIGGYSEGFSIFSGERRLIIVGDAFVIGNEPIEGDHAECALCAFFIADTITGMGSRDLMPIRRISTKNVVLEKDDNAWTIKVR